LKNKKEVIIIVLVVGIVLGYLIINRPANDPIFTFDSNKIRVTGIAFGRNNENQTKRIKDKGEINKIIKYLNTIEYKKITVDTVKESDGFTLALGRGESFPATILEFNENNITMSGPNPTYYQCNKDIIAELTRLYESCKYQENN
jgi:hypothetical protein